MISLTCTNCQTVLTIDEAFAGGVCRCQHCGTIQTVPAHLKKGAKAPRSGPPARALYTNKSRPDIATGTGLSNLSERSGSSVVPDEAPPARAAQPVKTLEPPQALPPKLHSRSWLITLLSLLAAIIAAIV